MDSSGKVRLMTFFSFILILFSFTLYYYLKDDSIKKVEAQTQYDDWPTVAHDVQRTSHSSDELRSSFTELWSKTWEGEMMSTTIEAIISDGKVFVGSYAGKMHALDIETGAEIWTFTTDNEAAIAHSPAVSGNALVFGDIGGKIYALDTAGDLLWEFTQSHGPGGFITSPAISNGIVCMGSQDGWFYGVSLSDGSLIWERDIGAPILQTAAIDNNIVYFGAEDMYAYALDISSGQLIWRSDKFYGVSMRDYYPVIAGDAVIFRTVPHTDFKWEDLTPDGEFLESYSGSDEQGAIIDRLNSDPYLKTFYVLDKASGEEKFVAPVLYGPVGNGGHPPMPTILENGQVVTYYRTDDSVWEHIGYPRHANFAIGTLDTTTGRIQQIYHNQGSSNNEWTTAWWCIGDESSTLSSGGNIVYNTHQGGISGIDINSGTILPVINVRDTWGGYERPIWASNEWHGVARGSIAISGDKYFWVVGSRLIAVRGQ